MIIIIIIMGFSTSIFAQKAINAQTKIDKITVFINNAQVERYAVINLPAGNSEILISGLSQFIDVNSLRVSGKGNYVIMSQQVNIKYPEPEAVEVESMPNHIVKAIKNLTDSLELLAFDIQENTAKKEVIIAEKNLIQTSTAITKTDTITELKDAIAFYRARMYDINQEWMKVMKFERLLFKQKTEMEERLTKLKNYSKNDPKPKNEAEPEAEISIQVMAEKAVTDARIEISYICSNVSWVPFYELKVDEVSKPVQLILKANLTQNTGEKWEKAKLTFSTGKPAAYKVLPILPAWYISYYNPQRYTTTMAGAAPASYSKNAEEDERKEVNLVTDAINISHYTQQNQSLIATEFAVSIPYTVLSDNRVNTITLMSEPLDATYKFFAIPKIDKDVFLTAYLQGWEKLNLVQGEAHIIYQNSIISKTFINASSVMDTLVVSLGVDKRVLVDRKKISDKSKDKVIGGTRERTVHFEITIKNQNQTDIEFLLKDQVPLSNTEDIKVIVEEISGAKYNEISGELEWTLKLKANEQKKLTLRYTIKYDKNKTVLSE